MIYNVDEGAVRLDVYLLQHHSLTRSHIKNLIDEGKVTVNGKHVKAGYMLRAGDVVETTAFDEVKPLQAVAQDIPLDIVYQDNDIAVINKPKGMVVHPAVKNTEGTLVNALLYRLDNLSGINGVLRPGIVHRIDKDTTGLLVVAKNDKAHVSLSNQIATKQCKRLYLAVMEGVVKEDGEIINYLARSKKNRLKFATNTSGEGKLAHSLYKVIATTDRYSLVQWELKTGRTHQIRAHAESIHHPIVGDKLYGSKTESYYQYGQMLHAYKLMLTHPTTNEVMTFTAPLPEYFDNFVQKFFDISNLYDTIKVE